MKKHIDGLINPIQQFLSLEAAGGILLIFAALFALVFSNSEFSTLYFSFWQSKIPVYIAGLSDSQSIQFWVNNGLMTLFFLFAGLEIKKEISVGVLRTPQKALLPLFAAIGGILFPLLIYTSWNPPGVFEHRGWGIPIATDIAFMMGIILISGDRMPFPLKVFLLALAIFDDLGTICIITLFYSGHLVGINLMLGLGLWGGLILANRLGVKNLLLYGLLGACLWLALLHSGLPATLAGVLTAFTIPHQNVKTKSMKTRLQSVETPLQRLEINLQPWVNFLILPIFALANAGVALQGGHLLQAYQNPVTLGIISGLFLGKPIGISVSVWLSQKFKWAVLPQKIEFKHIAAVSCFGGISFTMALFVASLAFGNTAFLNHAKIGILTALICSAFTGWAAMTVCFPKKAKG